jgi:hypothetical protein
LDHPGTIVADDPSDLEPLPFEQLGCSSLIVSQLTFVWRHSGPLVMFESRQSTCWETAYICTPSPDNQKARREAGLKY